MVQLRALSMAMLVGGAMLSHPAAAQHGNVSKSLMHVVSVTIAPRVRVELTPVSQMSSHSPPAAVKLTSNRGAAEGLALSVRATQSWVLSMKSRASSPVARDSKLRWSSSPRGEFTPVTSADTVLAAGTPSASSADTAVFFSAAQRLSASANSDETAVILSVTAP
ncbi:MAG: hypothetical protein WD802_01915 [Gemmatimonadaceae bacterium]